MLKRVPMNTGVCVVVAFALAGNLACGIIGPSCNDETGAVLTANEEVRASAERFFDVVSPKHSNLVMRLTWTDPNAELALRATITNCGDHVGCSMDTAVPSFGPGGSNPVPQPWPKGLREMEVDGMRGKTWRVAVSGDPARDASFALAVSYKITCES
jgi:hypothetical protein